MEMLQPITVLFNLDLLMFVAVTMVKIGFLLGAVMGFTAFLTWVERKLSSLMQDRVGPNRASIFGFTFWGLFHPVADGIKLMMKEDFMPARADKVLFTLAPVLTLVSVLAACCSSGRRTPAATDQREDDGMKTAAPAVEPSALKGIWQGVIKAGGQEIRLVFHLDHRDGVWSATVDSPDQGARGIPVASVKLEGAKITIDVPRVAGRYEGLVQEGAASIIGKWLQSGGAFAVDLVRVEPDEPWILWCGLNEESTALADALPDAVEVCGDDTYAEKTTAVAGFVAGSIRTIISKQKILGFGMNFQHCRRMAFVGMSDSYEAYYQAIRRCWRFGQQHPVDAWIVVSDAERLVVENVRRKEATAASLTDGLIEHMKDFEQEELAS